VLAPAEPGLARQPSWPLQGLPRTSFAVCDSGSNTSALFLHKKMVVNDENEVSQK
jgi:hypothetical protein